VSDTTYIFEYPRDMDSFGGRLARAREAAGLSPEDLASRLSVKIATVAAWERDRAAPTARQLATIAGLLGVSLSWLLHGVGPGAPAAEDEQLADLLVDLKRLKDEVAGVIVKVERHIAAGAF
jgi:transcriptional regulator with XRE-family HTH domain